MKNIEKALLFISRSTGEINRYHTEEDVLNRVALFLNNTPHDLQSIDRWIGTLNDDEFELLCDGDYTEMVASLSPPRGTNELLDDWFLGI